MEIALDLLMISSSLLMKVEGKRLSVSHTNYREAEHHLYSFKEPHRTIPCVAEMPEPLRRAHLLLVLDRLPVSPQPIAEDIN